LNGFEEDIFSNVLLNGKKIRDGEYSFEKFDHVLDILLGIAADAPERGTGGEPPGTISLGISVSIAKDVEANTGNPIFMIQSLFVPPEKYFFTLRIQGPGLTFERFKVGNVLGVCFLLLFTYAIYF
jgi:hypothetical protein